MLRSFRYSALLLVFAAAGLGAASAAAQQRIERIAAVVNDDVISTSAVEARLRLAVVAAGLPPSPENQRQLLPQVLRGLIDEKLREQEASRANITVSDEEIRGGIATIARQNNLSYDQFVEALQRAGVPLSTLQSQVRVQLAWTRLVQRRLVPTINIGEAEIDEVIRQMEASRGQPEYLLAEIFLQVDTPDQDAEVRTLAERLIGEIRRGAPFPAVARQFSQAAGANNGGDLGWIMQGQLDPALEAAVGQMQAGQLSDPIRSATGYHILLLREQRRANIPDALDTEIRMARIGLQLPPNARPDQINRAAQVARQISETVQGCDALAERARELGAGDTDGGRGKLRDLPPPLRALLQDLPIGQPTQPQRLPDGIAVFMVCERVAPDDGEDADRNRIAESLGEQRADMLQRRLLRDLRSAAYVDVRL